MNYKLLGNTGLNVSVIGLGTVSLGVDYGIEAQGEFGRPVEADAIRLLHRAADAGINLFDTAPSYGESERLVGQALGRRLDCCLATKLRIPKECEDNPDLKVDFKHAFRQSLENSLRVLHREALDIVQMHCRPGNTDTEDKMLEVLLDAKQRGKVRFIGISVYDEASALKGIESGCFDTLQVAYNVLDQRMARRVFPAAAKAGVGIMARSVFLKGVLTAKMAWLPPELNGLKQAAQHARDVLAGPCRSLQETALRYCLSCPDVSTALVGPRTEKELQDNLDAAEAGALPDALLEATSALAYQDEYMLSPVNWPKRQASS